MLCQQAKHGTSSLVWCTAATWHVNALRDWQFMLTFFSAGGRESAVEDGTSNVTPPSTTSFSFGAAALASRMVCKAT